MFTLGDLIEYLEKEDPKQIVPLGFRNPHSYRGYYDQLSFSPAKNVTVDSMLTCAKKALGATVRGWKGGEFKMCEYTQVWLSEEGDDSGQTIGPYLLDYMLGKYKGRSPLTWLDLAQQPVNSPHWKSKDSEEEYMYFADNQWLVTNEIVGPYRVRGIYKLIKEFKVE